MIEIENPKNNSHKQDDLIAAIAFPNLLLAAMPAVKERYPKCQGRDIQRLKFGSFPQKTNLAGGCFAHPAASMDHGFGF